MSMVRCEECERPVDSDDDPDCFVEVGNMRRLHKQIVLCEPCRGRHFDELEMRDTMQDQRLSPEDEAVLFATGHLPEDF